MDYLIVGAEGFDGAEVNSSLAALLDELVAARIDGIATPSVALLDSSFYSLFDSRRWVSRNATRAQISLETLFNNATRAALVAKIGGASVVFTPPQLSLEAAISLKTVMDINLRSLTL